PRRPEPQPRPAPLPKLPPIEHEAEAVDPTRRYQAGQPDEDIERVQQTVGPSACRYSRVGELLPESSYLARPPRGYGRPRHLLRGSKQAFGSSRQGTDYPHLDRAIPADPVTLRVDLK